MEEILAEKKADKKGTYAALKFSADTVKMLEKYMVKHDIPKPVGGSSLHSTLLYSRKYLLDYEPIGKLDETWTGKFTKFSIFPSNPKNGGNTSNNLVLEYGCKPQSERFNELMDSHDATYDFDEYKPHITLSTDVGDFDYKKLPKILEPLEIVEEYSKKIKIL